MALNEALEMLNELVTSFDKGSSAAYGDNRISTQLSPSIEDTNARQQHNQINNKSTQQICESKRSGSGKQDLGKSNGILECEMWNRQEPKNESSKSKGIESYNVIRGLRIHIGGHGHYDAFIVSFIFLLIIIMNKNHA